MQMFSSILPSLPPQAYCRRGGRTSQSALPPLLWGARTPSAPPSALRGPPPMKGRTRSSAGSAAACRSAGGPQEPPPPPLWVTLEAADRARVREPARAVPGARDRRCGSRGSHGRRRRRLPGALFRHARCGLWSLPAAQQGLQLPSAVALLPVAGASPAGRPSQRTACAGSSKQQQRPTRSQEGRAPSGPEDRRPSRNAARGGRGVPGKTRGLTPRHPSRRSMTCTCCCATPCAGRGAPSGAPPLPWATSDPVGTPPQSSPRRAAPRRCRWASS